MAGSRGPETYRKYYSQHKEIATTVKKDNAARYDASDVNKKIGSFKKGEDVTFINEGKYEARVLVKQGKDLSRVNIDHLVKPGSTKSKQASLKPQAFGITETKKYTVDQLETTVLNFLEERTDLSAQQKDYLEDLVLYHSQGEYISDSDLSESFKKIKSQTAFVNAVKTDFSELLGPFALIAFDLLEKIGLKYDIARNTKSWFPDLPNYPLMDYAVITGTGSKEQMLVVSAKAKPGSTNVVKPQDVLSLLVKQPKVLNKWKTTPQFGLLKILDENPIATGGVAAAGYLVSKLPAAKRRHKGITDAAVKDFIANKKNYDQTKWTTFIANNETIQRAIKDKKPQVKGGKIASTAINYACEKIVEAETVANGACPVTDIFVDAIKNQVYYAVYKQNPNGVPEWQLIASADFKEENALKIRTKNSLGSGSDKIGFQP